MRPSNTRSFESADRLGGVMFSDKIGDCVVEGGPDSFLTEKPWAAQLCAELGIAGDLIGSNDSQRITYIVVKGRLIPMPDGLMFMVPTKIIPTALTALFSWSTKFKMLGELLHPPQSRWQGRNGCPDGRAPLRSRGRGSSRRPVALRRLWRHAHPRSACAPCCPSLLRWRRTTARSAVPCWPPQKTGRHAKGQGLCVPSRCSALSKAACSR